MKASPRSPRSSISASPSAAVAAGPLDPPRSGSAGRSSVTRPGHYLSPSFRLADELNCSPSPLARSLALGETHTVAFVVPDIGNPTFQAMLSTLSKSAAADGYRVLVADSAEDPEEEAVLAVETRRGL